MHAAELAEDDGISLLLPSRIPPTPAAVAASAVFLIKSLLVADSIVDSGQTALEFSCEVITLGEIKSHS